MNVWMIFLKKKEIDVELMTLIIEQDSFFLTW